MEKYKNKKIVVTGATGLIASHLINKLMKIDGVKIIAISRSKKKLEEIFQQYSSNNNFRIIAQDISKTLPVFDEAIDYIFHAASPISGDIIRKMPVSVIEPNIIGTINCLNYLKKQQEERNHKGRLIVFSSATVYANQNKNDVTVDEQKTSIADSLDSPNIPYSESKRMVETLAQAYYIQYGIDIVIARFSYLYGYSYFTPQTAFYEFIRKTLKEEDISINCSDIPKRDNIYVEDAIDGVLCMALNGKSGEVYNISSNGERGNFAAADEIAKVMTDVGRKEYGKNVKIDYIQGVPDLRKPGIILDNSKLKKLGWSLHYTLYEGIKITMKEYTNYEVKNVY